VENTPEIAYFIKREPRLMPSEIAAAQMHDACVGCLLLASVPCFGPNIFSGLNNGRIIKLIIYTY
jgi:hypothetical protein